MKKCASCIKDLPDAALHCVFCGAKQPPAPAAQGLAKTAFGYSASDVVDQLRQQGAGQARPSTPPPAYSPPPAPAYNPPSAAPPPRPASAPVVTPRPQVPPYSSPPPMGLPTVQPPRPGPTGPSPSGPAYPSGPPATFVPASAANAATLFVPGRSPQPPQLAATMVPQTDGGSFGRPQPPQPQMSPTVVAPPRPPTPQPAPQMPPQMRIPAAQPPPYLAAQTASRAGRPIEPWKASLRLMMFVWGVGLLAVFATPLETSPKLVFYWTLILEGAGTARLPPLMLAAVGVLSMLVAGIPMQPAARGLLAAILGLAGIVVPVALTGLPAWQPLLVMIGTVVIIPSLLLRSDYRDAALPRVLVTIGALGVLLPYLVPTHGAIPLVGIFKSLVELPGAQKVAPALAFGQVVIVVMSLLAWLPSPVTGAAMLWAWLLILWSLVMKLALVLVGGNLVAVVTSKPNETLVSWISGGGIGIGLGLGAAYLVLVGYGVASVVGKQLE